MDNPTPPQPPANGPDTAPGQIVEAPAGPIISSPGEQPSPAPQAEPSAPVPPAEPAAPSLPPRDYVAALIDDAVLRIITAMHTRTKSEAFQQDLISRLHNDLQEQVNRSAVLPVVTSMLRLHEEMEKVAERMRSTPNDLTPEHMLRQFSEFAEDLGTLLEQAGVVRFVDEAQGNQFNGTRQSLLSREPTTDPALNQRISARVRPGAEFGKTLLRREAVRVYAYDPSLAAPATPPAAQPTTTEDSAP